MCTFEFLKNISLRTSVIKTISSPTHFKNQLLNWASQFREIIFLDSNEYPQDYSSYDCILAVDAFTSIKTDFHNAFDDLNQYQQSTKDWLFGYLSYDLKNTHHDLVSNNNDELFFADMYFFQPKKIFLLKGNTLEIEYLMMCDDELTHDFEAITETLIVEELPSKKIQIEQRISKEKYLENVTKMLDYINKGDIYEANFCMEYFSRNVQINPLETYQKLTEISKTPFATFFKNNNHFLMSASPERFLRKQGNKIISQPIKGTAKRFFDAKEDENAKLNLALNAKERSENIMIVDLVRNDLSQTANKGTVVVEELCKIYKFKQVHQMISTITSKVSDTISPIEILKTTFPMGSMTGAPKLSAMKIIEELEDTKRGLYSGALGYFLPDGDFDFNVVIRSILYNNDNKYLSFSVGSAITSLSIPENEYEECQLKAKAMLNVLENK
jgi:para-aminobenzoate synthetase component 1